MATRLHGCAHRILLVTFLAAIFFCSARDLRAELFRVALSTKDFGYLPLYVGMRAGLFAQENLEIQWIVVNSNVVVTALLAGEIDVAGIAGSSMRAAARGAPLKANFFPYDKSLFVLMGAPSIKRVQDLKGKVIGTTGPGATTEVAASMVLQNHGMDPKKDVTFMTIGGAETSIVAMRNGIIQARAFNPDAALHHEEARLHRTRRARRHGALALGGLLDLRRASGESARQTQTLDPRHGKEPAIHDHAQRRNL